MLQGSGAVRHQFSVRRPGDATGRVIAELFDEAARRIEALGPVFIRHTALDTVEDARCAEVSLTVYYDADPTAVTLT